MGREPRTRNKQRPTKVINPNLPKVLRIQDVIEMVKPFKPGSGTLHRKAIEEGFEEIKKQLCIQNIDYGGDENYKPAKVNLEPQKHWLDKFVEESLGGYRDGLKIKWVLADGSICTWDPFENKVTKEENAT
jgi:hypothetical protein